MNREELIKQLKENNGVAYNNTTEDGIRQIIRFIEYGHFCGYIGVPKNHKLFNAANNYDKASKIFDYSVHGGITYCEFELPDVYEYNAQNSYRFIGFDCGHACDGKDFKLVEEIWGKEKADKAFSLYSYLKDKPVISFEQTLEDVERMTKIARMYEKFQEVHNDNVYVSDIEWDIDEDEEVSANELPEVVVIPFDAIENENGVLDPDKAIDIATDDANFCIKSCTVNIQIEVPFSDAIIFASDELSQRITNDSLWNIFDDFPMSITAKIPLDVMQDYYENHVLCDFDWKSDKDIRMSEWLESQYTLDDTRDLLVWWDMYYDYDIHNAIINIDDMVKQVDDYISEHCKEEDLEK